MCYSETELWSQNLDPILGSIVHELEWEGQCGHRKRISLWPLTAFASPTLSLGLKLTNLCDLYVELAVVAIGSFTLWLSLHHSAHWHNFFYTLSCCKFGHSSKCNPYVNYVYDLIHMHGGGWFIRCVQYRFKISCDVGLENHYCVASMWVVETNTRICVLAELRHECLELWVHWWRL